MQNRSTDAANRTTVAGRAAIEWRKIVLPMGLVMFSLITVVVVMVTLGRKSRELRIELADLIGPATAGLSDLQRILALELAARRHWFGDPSRSFSSYGALREEEAALYQRLQPQVHALGADADIALERLRVTANQWHHVIELSPKTETDFAAQQSRYAEVLAAADQLSGFIARAADARRDSIANRERLEDRLIMAMVVLAAISVSVLLRVGYRLHHLTKEATYLAHVAQHRQEELEQAGREKEVFVRGITHDLKNPIGAIDAYAELLELGVRGELAAEQKQMVARIRRCARQTMRIITDLLELAKTEAASLKIHSQDIDINRLAADVVEDYRATLEASGFSLVLEPSPEQPRVLTDAARLREILGNLLMNAAKHTPSGGQVVVEVDASCQRLDSSDAVAVKVSDSGPGVPSDMRERIFEEFTRGTDSTGSGIGLAISRKMARTLGGDLVLSGAPSGGASFALIVPYSHDENSTSRT